MNSQHLSDEAIAAFADGVLCGHARERASRHADRCPECAHAITVQREAVWALRAAPAPPLPVGLLDRLRSVPSTTPIHGVPAAIGADGSALFAAFGTMSAAALVAPTRASSPQRDARSHRMRPIALTAAAVAAAGVLAAGSGLPANGSQPGPARHNRGGGAGLLQPSGGAATVVPAGVQFPLGR